MAKKILIVEDDINVLELIMTAFNIEEYEVLCAMDGEEALRIAKLEKPDVTLLDIQIPKLNGYQVCEAIKQDPNISHTKIVMLSGMVQSADLLKAQKAGTDDYVTKPFSIQTLINTVERLINSD